MTSILILTRNWRRCSWRSLRFLLRSVSARAVLLAFMIGSPAASCASSSTILTDSTYLIDAWEVAEDLPGYSIAGIAQSSDGFLWLGTLKGLVRFDGVEFRAFDSSSVPQVPDSTITRLHLDRRGNLCTGTVRGLAVRRGTEWHTLALPGTNNNRGNHFVHSLADRSQGDLLVTTLDGGVLEYRGGQFHALPQPPGATNTAYLGAADDAGNWWVAQHEFIGKWDGQRWLETVSLAGLTNLAPKQVGLAPGRTGGLWLLLGSELRQYRGGKETQRIPVPGFKGEVSDLMEDSRGQVWIGTKGAGLWQVSSNHPVRHWSTSPELGDATVESVFEDREQNVWVGTRHGGLRRFKERAFHNLLPVTNRLAFARFALAASPTGGVFIASFKQGLWWADAAGLRKVSLPRPFHDSLVSALSVLVDRTGAIWIGAMTNGVWRIQGQDARWMALDESGRSPVHTLFEDSRGRIWMAGGESVSAFESGEMRGFGPAQGLPPGRGHALAEDKAGAIWLAHERGVFRLDTHHWLEVLDARGLSLRMTSLRADSDGAMWMTSSHAGLFRWHAGRLIHQPLPPELPMRGVYTIREDLLGWFWMTSTQGVLRGRKSDVQSWLEGKQPTVAWQLFGVGDGLPAAECGDSAWDEQGRLWFTTARGVAWRDAAAEPRNPTPPPVKIEELTYYRAAPHVYGGGAVGADSAPVQSRSQGPFPATLTLPPGSRRLEVRYTALDFTAPEQLRFQIKLEPNDRDWQDVGPRRVAYYYDFNPGNYVFRVRAVSRARVWKEESASLAFVVQPFLWQTAWFRAGLALLLVGSLGGAMGLWVRARLRRAAEYEKTAGEMRNLAGRLITAQEEERKRLARELHDDLSQSLALLSVDLELFGQKPLSAPDQIDTRMRELSSQVRGLSSEVHRLSHELHPAKLEQLGLVAAVRSCCKELSAAHQLAVHFEAGEVPRALSKDVALCLYRITQEALQNVVKHSEATSAQVALVMGENEICLSVVDDGVGFDAPGTEGKGSLGLVSMRERARLVRGRLSVESKKGGGTRVEVRVPLVAAAGGEQV